MYVRNSCQSSIRTLVLKKMEKIHDNNFVKTLLQYHLEEAGFSCWTIAEK